MDVTNTELRERALAAYMLRLLDENERNAQWEEEWKRRCEKLKAENARLAKRIEALRGWIHRNGNAATNSWERRALAADDAMTEEGANDRE